MSMNDDYKIDTLISKLQDSLPRFYYQLPYAICFWFWFFTAFENFSRLLVARLIIRFRLFLLEGIPIKGFFFKSSAEWGFLLILFLFSLGALLVYIFCWLYFSCEGYYCFLYLSYKMIFSIETMRLKQSDTDMIRFGRLLFVVTLYFVISRLLTLPAHIMQLLN